MENTPKDEEMLDGADFPRTIAENLCNEMNNLLGSAEALLQPDEEDSMLAGPDLAQA